MGQEIILLRFVEMMDFVNKQHGRLARALKLLGFLNDFFEIFDSRGDRGKMHTLRARRIG